MKTILTILTVFAVIAPAATLGQVAVTVEQGDFSPATFFYAPKIPCLADGLNECNYSVQLARLKDGQPVWRLTLWARYGFRWRFYNSVSLVGGHQIPEATAKRTPLGCYRSSCDYLELVNFAIPDELLPKDRSPLRVRFNATDYGSFEGSVPVEHFEAIRAKAGNQ